MKYLISILSILIIQGQSLACSCTYPTEVPKAFEASHTIVYGEIVELQIVKVSESMDRDSLEQFMINDLTKFQSETLNADFLIKVKIKKKEILKGSTEQEIITLYTTRTGASCGFTRFEIGREYIVYASPKSYFFSNFYSPQKNRKLEKQNTYWVTNCSITSEFDQEHLTAIKAVKYDRKIVEISKLAFRVLRQENLLKDRDQINTTIFCGNCEGIDNPIEFDDEEIVTDLRISSLDLMIRIVKIEENQAEIRFKSYDDGGYEHSGDIKLIEIEGEWKKESINYVTAIE
jgi:hypothetical protein